MGIALDSPKALATQIGAGMLLATIAFIVFALSMRRPVVISVGVAALVGIGISSWAELRLRNGLQNERWPKELLAPLVRWFGNPVLFAAALLVSLASIGYDLGTNFHHGVTGFWIALFPLQTGARVKTLLTPPPTAVGVELNLRNAQPVQSQGWGMPR
jgi:hypothetical protein